MNNAIAIIIHLLAINIWIGGTFYSVIILPRAVAALPPVQQHQILISAFSLFFAFVWLAIVMLLASGSWMVINIFGGFSTIPLYVTMMMSITLLMVAVFSGIYFGPFKKLKKSLDDIPAQHRYLAVIRRLSQVNMVLGIGIVIVIGGGPHFFV